MRVNIDAVLFPKINEMGEHVALGSRVQARIDLAVEVLRQRAWGRRAIGQGRQYLRLAALAVRYQPGKAVGGAGHRCTVAGIKDAVVARRQPPARGHEGAHIAVRRRDQRTGPAHDMIAGKDRPVRAKTHVIGHVSGRVQRLDAPAVAVDHLAVAQPDVGYERLVHAFATADAAEALQRHHGGAAARLRWPERQNRCAAKSRQTPRQWRMVQMAVGHQNMGDNLIRLDSRQNRCKMCGVVGPGVDHRNAPSTQNIGISPGLRHRRRVRCQHPPDPRPVSADLDDLVAAHLPWLFRLPGLGLTVRCMSYGWLRRPLPRSLYGRAALILIVPIVTIQFVVSMVFIQRHYEGVTQQMTGNLIIEISYLLREVDAAASPEAAQAAIARLTGPLALEAQLPGDPLDADLLRARDLSGKAMVETLRLGIDGVLGVDLIRDRRRVHLAIATRHGPLALGFERGRVSASNPHQLLVLMIFTSLLMTGIAFIFLRNQLRPIKRLAETAAAFGRGQSRPFKPTGAIEVRAAGNAFLDMRARIERQIEQRTLMLSGVSHDLRTPLTRLRLGLSMLDDSAETEALKRDVNDMEKLLDAFLEFARTEALEDPVVTNPVDLARSIADGATRLGGAVEFIATDETAQVSLRPMSIGRALDNLIGNALRYGDRARVSVDFYDRAVRFRVEDDGPGIPAQKRDAALQAFSRLEPARNQNRGTGVGLGLTITMDIARSHGGTLRLGESTTLGGLQADLVIAR